jgi:hypothetical protein
MEKLEKIQRYVDRHGKLEDDKDADWLVRKLIKLELMYFNLMKQHDFVVKENSELDEALADAKRRKAGCTCE